MRTVRAIRARPDRLLGARDASRRTLDLVVPHDRRLDADMTTALVTADLAAHHRVHVAQLTAGRVADPNQDGDTP